MKSVYNFPQISLLITHYNRTNSLERLLTTFNDLNCHFGEIVISDDFSDDNHISRLQELSKIFNFNIILSTKNNGLAANINKGQKKTTKLLTLYLQEDFIPSSKFPSVLERTQSFFLESNIDIVRFSSNFNYPYLSDSKLEGFSKMKFNLFNSGYSKFYFYSDHPHLRRSDFLDKFGEYPVGFSGDRAEYIFMIKFLQKKGTGLFYNDYNSLFEHQNDDIESSTMQRSYLSSTSNPIVMVIRNLYRHFKFNFNYLFSYK